MRGARQRDEHVDELQGCARAHTHKQRKVRERDQALPHETPESNPSQKEGRKRMRRRKRRRRKRGTRSERQKTEQESATDIRRTAASLCRHRAAQREINRQTHSYIQDSWWLEKPHSGEETPLENCVLEWLEDQSRCGELWRTLLRLGVVPNTKLDDSGSFNIRCRVGVTDRKVDRNVQVIPGQLTEEERRAKQHRSLF